MSLLSLTRFVLLLFLRLFHLLKLALQKGPVLGVEPILEVGRASVDPLLHQIGDAQDPIHGLLRQQLPGSEHREPKLHDQAQLLLQLTLELGVLLQGYLALLCNDEPPLIVLHDETIPHEPPKQRVDQTRRRAPCPLAPPLRLLDDLLPRHRLSADEIESVEPRETPWHCALDFRHVLHPIACDAHIARDIKTYR